MEVMDVDSGLRQLLKAWGEKLMEEKQWGVSAKTENRLMGQKRKSRNSAHVRAACLQQRSHSNTPTAGQREKTTRMPGVPPQTTHRNHSRWIGGQNVRKKTMMFLGKNLYGHEVTKDMFVTQDKEH